MNFLAHIYLSGDSKDILIGNFIGDYVKGTKDGKAKEIFIYNICDHAKCYQEVESQAICYTAGVPPAAAAVLIANGVWDVNKMVNVEELDPDPFIELLNQIGLPAEVEERPVPLPKSERVK